jgi:hypothetical protein
MRTSDKSSDIPPEFIGQAQLSIALPLLVLVKVLAKHILDDLARHAGLRLSHMLLSDRSGYHLCGCENDQTWDFSDTRRHPHSPLCSNSPASL